MGQNKASLPDLSKSGTLLDRAFSLAEELSSFLNQESGGIFVSGNFEGRRSIRDLIEGCGPLSGMHAALVKVLESGSLHEYILFLPVDMPELKVLTLSQLIYTGCLDQNVADAVCYDGYELPALISVKKEIVDRIEKRLLDKKGGDVWSVYDFLQSLSSRRIPLEPKQEMEFLNMNTLSDFKSWSGQ